MLGTQALADQWPFCTGHIGGVHVSVCPERRARPGRARHARAAIGALRRRDLQEAMEAGLIKVQDMDLALAVGTGVMVFALRAPRAREGGDARGLQVVRAILSGLGVTRALRTKALAIQLPDMPAAKARSS